FCLSTRRHADAARLYAAGFRADASLADNLDAAHRYNAACYAARATAGRDAGVKPIDEQERVRLRGLALGWLRDDLAAWTRSLDGGKPEDRDLVAEKMRHWQKDTDLAGVRDAAALARLPEAERAKWHKLWQDVDALLKRAEHK